VNLADGNKPHDVRAAMRYGLTAALVFGLAAQAQADATGRDTRDLIRQARQIIHEHGDAVWRGIKDAPFGILLVDGDTETLYCHPGSPEDFEPGGIDPVTGCEYAERPARFPPNLLASFPAVAATPTIVIGTPEATARSPDEWVLTIIHEHFHQMQFAQPFYYAGVDALDLSGGDESGMWMLNYPFPYDRAVTAEAFSALATALIDALDARGSEAFEKTLAAYWRAREAARETVSESDWRYIELQLWQEGVARWTEHAVAGESAVLAATAQQAGERTRMELIQLTLSEQGRVAVYAIGAAEAMLLDAAGPGWRDDYWSSPFALGPSLRKLVIRLSGAGTP